MVRVKLPLTVDNSHYAGMRASTHSAVAAGEMAVQLSGAALASPREEKISQQNIQPSETTSWFLRVLVHIDDCGHALVM